MTIKSTDSVMFVRICFGTYNFKFLSTFTISTKTAVIVSEIMASNQLAESQSIIRVLIKLLKSILQSVDQSPVGGFITKER